MKKELRMSLAFLGLYLVFNRFLNIPDVILGFLMGIGLLLVVIGILPEKTYLKIKKLKNTVTKPS